MTTPTRPLTRAEQARAWFARNCKPEAAPAPKK